MTRESSRYLLRYGIAILAVTVALLVTLLIWPLVRPMASPLFLVAIMVGAWLGGRGPGFLTTVLAAVVLDFFFIPPIYELGGSWEDLNRVVVFVLEGLVISWLIAARKNAGEEVIRSREQLRALSVHLQSVREEEMARIAREIHDELGQVLTGLKYDVHWIKNREIRNMEYPPRQLLVEKTETLLRNIDAAILSVRRITTELRPAVLDDLGLTAAIEWQAKDFEQRTGIVCRLSADLEDFDPGKECATAAFRIFQESLTNVARHAHATAVKIDLKVSGGCLFLRLEDNGRGIKDEELAQTKSFGILGMQERARLLNGSLSVTGHQGQGTIVALQIPVSTPLRQSQPQSAPVGKIL